MNLAGPGVDNVPVDTWKRMTCQTGKHWENLLVHAGYIDVRYPVNASTGVSANWGPALQTDLQYVAEELQRQGWAQWGPSGEGTSR